MVRYLLFFSYIGTKFNGSQRQSSKQALNNSVSTVQGAIEAGLGKLGAANAPIHVVGSSRTDAGVHAFESTVHVDLRHFEVGNYYKPDVVTYTLNLYLADKGHDVRILRTRIVPDQFSCRYNAKNRTYVYRVAVLKKEILPGLLNFTTWRKYESLLPLQEMNVCNLVYPPFDEEAAEKATHLFRGTHNFTSFMMKQKEHDTRLPRNPVRNMEICEMTPGRGILSEHDQFHNHLQYWDFTFKSSGFLQRQVRRMVGTICAVGAGKLKEADVIYMLKNPSHLSWMKFNPGHTPPQGLFLKKISYIEKEMVLPADYFEVIKEHHNSTYLNQKQKAFAGIFEIFRERTKQLSG